MSTNWALLMAMHDSGLRQRDFVRVAGDHESLISRVIIGVWNLDEILQTRYAKALGKRIEDFFKMDRLQKIAAWLKRLFYRRQPWWLEPRIDFKRFDSVLSRKIDRCLEEF